MDSDRRQFSRCEPAKLVYARFGKANGGIVLNASLGGLCFQTVAPTQADNVVELTVSPTAKESIPVTGKIIWTDDAGKMGGLEFVDPAPEVQARLTYWLSPQMANEEPKSGPAQGVTLPDAPGLVSGVPKPSSPEPMQTPPPAAVPVAASTPLFELPPRYKSSSTVPRMFGTLTGAAAFPETVETERPRRSSNRLLRVFSNLIIFGLLLLLPAAYIYNFHPQFAYSLIDRAKPLYSGTDAAKQVEPPPAVPDPNAAGSSGTPPAAAPPELESEKSSNPVKTPSAEVRPEHTGPTTPAESPLPKAEKRVGLPPDTKGVRIQPDRFHRSPVMTLPVDPNDPNELWLAVGQGDTEAEVALARLYLTGRLVEKNCEQGRVLLNAASKKGNATAISELRELIRRGCK